MTEQPHKRQKMMVCRNCNTEITLNRDVPASTHCPGCGTQVAQPLNPLQQRVKKIMPMKKSN